MLRKNNKRKMRIALLSITLLLIFSPATINAQDSVEAIDVTPEVTIDEAAVPLSGGNGTHVSAFTYVAIVFVGIVVITAGTYMFVKKRED